MFTLRDAEEDGEKGDIMGVEQVRYGGDDRRALSSFGGGGVSMGLGGRGE